MIAAIRLKFYYQPHQNLNIMHHFSLETIPSISFAIICNQESAVYTWIKLQNNIDLLEMLATNITEMIEDSNPFDDSRTIYLCQDLQGYLSDKIIRILSTSLR